MAKETAREIGSAGYDPPERLVVMMEPQDDREVLDAHSQARPTTFVGAGVER